MTRHAPEGPVAPLELARYCIPYTPVTKPIERSRVCLVSTAGVYHKVDPPFEPAGDNSYRSIPGDAAAADLRIADEHYPHDCVDADLNCVFPIDRVRELASEGVVAGLTDLHFSMGFTQQLAAIRSSTVPDLARSVDRARPDIVLLTGG